MNLALICQYCGMSHSITCPRIKAMEYHPDGTIKRIEFHEPNATVTSDDRFYAKTPRYAGGRNNARDMGTRMMGCGDD